MTVTLKDVDDHAVVDQDRAADGEMITWLRRACAAEVAISRV